MSRSTVAAILSHTAGDERLLSTTKRWGTVRVCVARVRTRTRPGGRTLASQPAMIRCTSGARDTEVRELVSVRVDVPCTVAGMCGVCCQL